MVREPVGASLTLATADVAASGGTAPDVFGDAFKADVLAEFGFAGERGARAAERAVARFLEDEEVFANAKRLFELCSDV